MMDKFWEKLSQANAFLVSMFALIFFLIALIWVLRSGGEGTIEIGGMDPRSADHSGEFEARPSNVLSLPDVALQPSRNPFSSEYIQKVNDQLAWAAEMDGIEPAEKDGTAQGEGKNGGGGEADPESSSDDNEKPPNEEESPPPPPQPRRLRLIYRGMIKHLDGSTLALIENLGSDSRRYHPMESEIEWVKIVDFSRKTLDVSDGAKTYTLQRGVPFEIVEKDVE